jgi:hypothetical protein
VFRHGAKLVNQNAQNSIKVCVHSPYFS